MSAKAVTAQLSDGELELRGQIVAGHNAVFLGQINTETNGDQPPLRCVYKPIDGEQPLWDFPGKTLAPREVAAYRLDQATGWGMVPPTVLRDGPLGRGSCQLWVDADDSVTVFDVLRPRQLPSGWKVVARGTMAGPADDSDLDDADRSGADQSAAQPPVEHEVLLAHADDPRLARLAVFDAVINNSDRKGGHLLTDTAGQLWAIDHGIAFHPDPKLRTVLWGWAGQPLPDDIGEVLARLDTELAGELGAELESYLDAEELAATVDRVQRLLREARFPEPTPGWPVLPYPLF